MKTLELIGLISGVILLLILGIYFIVHSRNATIEQYAKLK
jgi:cell division protein FtsN